MSGTNLAKTSDEVYAEHIALFKLEHGCSFRMEDVAKWILDNELLPPPDESPEKRLTRRLKQAARRRRMRDLQGRTVREMLAAKVELVDADGNKVFEVVWDFLHEMSVHHALTAFSQRGL